MSTEKQENPKTLQKRVGNRIVRVDNPDYIAQSVSPDYIAQSVSPETSTMTATELNAWTAERAFRRIEHFAEVMAVAILRNPKVDQLLGRNPLDPGRAGDHANSGAALAHAAHRLAKDYLETMDALVLGERSPRRAVDENADPNRPA